MKKASDLSREEIVYSAGDLIRRDLQSGVGEAVLDFLDVAHWASKRQIQIGVRGFANKKYSTLERLLKRWEKWWDRRI